jgi:formylglycine-generating enzyme required for sulfatase activity
MSERFKDLKNGIILDHKTGLQWQAKAQKQMPWQEARNYAKSLRLGKYADWRLPTIEELETLLNREKYDPASDFPNMSNYHFWSSSSYAYNLSYAWVVDFYLGYVSNNDKTYGSYARCVRSGS